jgi:tRNA pseudouridine38-40 synthase
VRTLKITLEYDGSDFHGWQRQPGLRTVQSVVEEALSSLLCERVSVVGSGRTDTGVHALGQVASVVISGTMPEETITRGLNALLPLDVAALTVSEVEAGFHARFSAKARCYRYRIAFRKVPLRRRYVWNLRKPIDAELVREASANLLGKHDFTTFAVASSAKDENWVRVDRLEWSEHGDELVLEIEADRFLHHMVRIIVGTMVKVGQRVIGPDEIQKMLDQRDRRVAGATAPARGLCLVAVKYT